MSRSTAAAVRRLEGLLVTKLWAAQVAFQARLEHALARAGFGLTSAGFRLVGELMSAPQGLRQAELALRLGVKAPTVSVAISKLEAAGVVERVDDEDDPRAWRVRLAADAPIAPGVEVLEALERELFSTLTSADRRAFTRLFDSLTTRLTRGAS